MYIPHKSPRQVAPPTPDDLAAARDTISRHLTPTPLIPAPAAGSDAWLKLESFQPTGSFKVRGALAAMSSVAPGSEVLAVSAGNHALGIGWASGQLGIPATVVIAETASPAKRAKLEALPITLIRHGHSYDEAEAWTIEQAASADARTAFISAYNDPGVIAGASTVLDEIVTQAPEGPLTVLVPASGGGLLAGVAMRSIELATSERPITVIAVESEVSPAISAAMAAGEVVDVPIGTTIADGITGNIEPGSVTVSIAAPVVSRVIQVSDREIREAIRFIVSTHGLIAEGAGAAATAALLAGKVGEVAGSVVAIVSGRNIALPLLAEILAGQD